MSLDLKLFGRAPAARPESVTAPESHFRVVAPEAEVRLDTDTKAWQWVNYVVKQQMPEYVMPPMTADHEVVAEAEAITQQAAQAVAEAEAVVRQAVADNAEIIDDGLAYAKADLREIGGDPVAENEARARQAAAEAQAVQASGGYSADAFVHEYFNMPPSAPANVPPAAPVPETNPYTMMSEAGIANPQLDGTGHLYPEVGPMVQPAPGNGLDEASIRQQIDAAYGQQEGNR